MNGGGPSGRGAFAGAILLLATGAALVASATIGAAEREDDGGTAADEPTPRSIERRARRLTPLVARRVERIRDLEFERVPRPRVITGEQFAAITAREADRERGAEPRGPTTWKLDRGWIASSAAGESIRLGFAPSARLARLAAGGAGRGSG